MTALVVELPAEHRCLSSAVLNGGLGRVRTWLNLQVPHDYARTDPEAHLAAVARHLRGPVVGMMTAADVGGHTAAEVGAARAIATVGIGQPLAAAGTRPRLVDRVGTINLLIVVAAPLSAAALAGGLQTAVEAKAQALADARVRAVNAAGFATGTATDSICLAARLGDDVAFAGPATAVGADIARAVHSAVLEGALQARHAPSRTAQR
jgi:adenosylcobinamide amidohydrolase